MLKPAASTSAPAANQCAAGVTRPGCGVIRVSAAARAAPVASTMTGAGWYQPANNSSTPTTPAAANHTSPTTSTVASQRGTSSTGESDGPSPVVTTGSDGCSGVGVRAAPTSSSSIDTGFILARPGGQRPDRDRARG